MKALANIEAEQVVLATLLNDPKSVHFSQMLHIDDFTDKSHRLIFEAFDGAAREGRHASPIVLSPQFERDRVTNDLIVFEAKNVPPQTTRAKLRGDFIRRAQERRRDFTVDWVHLKLNDQAQRTVLCKDPFRSADERVEKLMAGM